MRYRQNTKGDILYGPPVILHKKMHFFHKNETNNTLVFA